MVGPPSAGKTTFSMWLENPRNYSGGVLNMGACDSTTNALHLYRDQAVVIFDYPLGYDWARKSEIVGNLCEFFFFQNTDQLVTVRSFLVGDV